MEMYSYYRTQALWVSGSELELGVIVGNLSIIALKILLCAMKH